MKRPPSKPRLEIWDEGAAAYYRRGRLPYPASLRETFEADLRRLLEQTSDHGRFSQQLGGIQLYIYERP